MSTVQPAAPHPAAAPPKAPAAKSPSKAEEEEKRKQEEAKKKEEEKKKQEEAKKAHHDKHAPRSPQDVAKEIADLLKKEPGLRADQIKTALSLEDKEMAKGLKAGLDKKALASNGDGASATYSAN
jgi:colicin import membrane protein